MKFGIIGHGRFGQLWSNTLRTFGDVVVHDRNPDLHTQTLDDAAQSDMLFIITPISDIQQTCLALKPFLKPETIVLDCCSVKIHPVKIMLDTFSEMQPIIATHPLFGPDSVSKWGMENQKIVMCPVRCNPVQLETTQHLFHQLKLKTIVTTPENHDQQMANSQTLVHFIGRGLEVLHLTPQDIATPDYNALLNIKQMVLNDTWQLFLDMHLYNPYAKKIREKFLHRLTELDQEVSNHVID